MTEHTIAATTHGRYLVSSPNGSEPAPLLVGFHGYGEGADVQLDRLRAIPGSEAWVTVSIQGLHRFYQRRTNEVIASWMTRQDREHAIADNLAYVSAALEQISRDMATLPRVVFAGFSQGVAMAFRAAAASARPVGGLIAVGGDVPPEIGVESLARIGSALVCRGARDPLYAPATFENDLRRLRDSSVTVTPLEFDGGHEWSAPVLDAASTFLSERRR